jgi:hypothetical protein
MVTKVCALQATAHQPYYAALRSTLTAAICLENFGCQSEIVETFPAALFSLILMAWGLCHKLGMALDLCAKLQTLLQLQVERHNRPEIEAK